MKHSSQPSLRMVGLFSAIASILSAGCSSERPPAEEQIQQGRAIYARACANCHGAQGEGMPMLGRGLQDNAFMEARTDSELVDFLKEGRPSNHELNTTGVDMPPRGGDPSLDDQKLESLVAFLRTF